MVTTFAAAAQEHMTWPDVAFALAVFAGIALCLWVFLRWL
jgi:hypothetical protein